VQHLTQHFISRFLEATDAVENCPRGVVKEPTNNNQRKGWGLETTGHQNPTGKQLDWAATYDNIRQRGADQSTRDGDEADYSRGMRNRWHTPGYQSL